ncbi:unnamed protein product [Oppiella nova]|uniref:Nuclear receptor domain-containing protein n=1 Tax=Oppiella nova TaxID=334625 RepID=A0A7R9QT54_9ACAR|nr:unnamed protein product [Oppiella nova]CAG2173008.1 unnamed protein product [Oppiella nova]
MCEKPQKFCRICGDLATGYHFDGLSCNSCKSFFRRSAFLKTTFTCHLAEQKQQRICIIEKNRKLKNPEKSNSTQTNANSVVALPSPPLSMTSYSDILGQTCDDQIINIIDDTVNANLNDNQINSNSNVLNLCNNSYGSDESDLLVVPISSPITDYSNQFNELEGNKLSELLDALKVLQISDVSTDYSIVNNCVDALNIIIGKIDDKIANVVKMSKRLDGFNNMCENDQMVVIKHSAFEIDILRMILRFNFEDQYFIVNEVIAIEI